MSLSLPGPRAVSALDRLLDSRVVWRAQESAAEAPASAVASGHPALDAALPAGGWPRGAISELLSDGAGSGELALLWPLLTRLTREQRPVVLVAPPALPYPAAWRQAGVELGHCHWLDVHGREALWATEQCLRAGCCAAVLAWLPQADARALRRLQVAAASGDTLGFVHRPLTRVGEASPAALRLRLHGPGEGHTPALEVLKCRGGWPHATRIAIGAGA
ncbi:translesion DNA synthesis-associated protein ImuA [Salinicola endophyticus]|uniref:translesion DNA synthesis-associated protein ImuA n=1 Tax=Salinicola endophyticus TaxID=1949083 RepID=UPI00249ABEB8|nr:translesion DNA synthesis-associated protein ImuA [Salinicola endophyticus]